MSSSRRLRAQSVLVLALTAAVLSGCGSNGSAESDAGTEVKAITGAAQMTPSTSVPRIVVPDTITTQVSIVEPTAEPVLVAMPAVVCMNLQSAQDAIQAAGVFFSRSADASGEGRIQLNDSNWVVVEQDPPAGTLVGEGDALLSAVKIGEPNNC